MKKILLILFVLIPINVFSMEQNKLHIYVDTSSIDGFNFPVYINYIEDTKKDDPPLEHIELNKENNYELTLTKGVDFKDFIFESIEITNDKNYEVKEESFVSDDTLNYNIQIKREIPLTTLPKSTEVISVDDIIIGEDETTTKTTQTTTSNVTNEKNNSNKKIYSLVFLGIFGIVIILMIIGIVKISKANK